VPLIAPVAGVVTVTSVTVVALDKLGATSAGRSPAISASVVSVAIVHPGSIGREFDVVIDAWACVAAARIASATPAIIRLFTAAPLRTDECQYSDITDL